MDFLNAVSIPTCEVRLAGKTIRVARCPLLQHYALRDIARQLAASDPRERLDAVFRYLQTATGSELAGVGVEELAPALAALIKLNSQLATLPWQDTVRKEPKSTNADYDNRELAIMVDTIAGAYGWDEERVFSLQPEAAACYVQEILLSDWERREFEYKLSQVAYDGKTGRYIKFPMPLWYYEVHGLSYKDPKAWAMVPARFMPDGVVIDLTKQGNGHAEKEESSN